MGDNVIPRQQGDAYQAGFFWTQACQLFLPHTGVSKIEWESSSTIGFDDVVLHYRPGEKIDEGDNLTMEQYQVKFHVDHQRAFTCDALIDPTFIGTQNDSILSRLHKCYQANPATFKITRFYVVNTWGLDSGDEFRSLIGNGGAIRLGKLFDDTTDASRKGKVRKRWRDYLNCSDNELKEVLRSLRIIHSYADLKGIEDRLNDKLLLAGFKPIDAGHRATVYYELIQKLHAEGRKTFTREELFEICNQEGLVLSKTTEQPSYHIIGIRSFQRGAEMLQLEVNEILCLLNHFSDRFLNSETSWNEVIKLVSLFADKALGTQKPILAHLDTHLSIAFCLGYQLDFKFGAQVSIVQKTMKGKLIWAPDPNMLSTAPTDVWNWNEKTIHESEGDIILALNVTHMIADDVSAYVTAKLPKSAKMLTGTLKKGSSNTVFQNANEIVIAIQELVARVRSIKRQTGIKSTVHLFMAAPNAFAFFLGQQSRPLGKIVLYEFDFNSQKNGSYEAAISLPID